MVRKSTKQNLKKKSLSSLRKRLRLLEKQKNKLGSKKINKKRLNILDSEIKKTREIHKVKKKNMEDDLSILYTKRDYDNSYSSPSKQKTLNKRIDNLTTKLYIY